MPDTDHVRLTRDMLGLGLRAGQVVPVHREGRDRDYSRANGVAESVAEALLSNGGAQECDGDGRPRGGTATNRKSYVIRTE